MRGFILQPTYRIESGRPVVHLFGRLESGAPFLIRDGSDVPHFFIRAGDEERARGLGAASLHPTSLRTMEGEEVLRVEVAIPSETPPLRDRLAAAGVQPFEADVRFAMRFLIDRGIKGAVEIQGEPKEVRLEGGPPPLLVFEAPRLAPSDWAPKLAVLSLDIETDPRGQKVFSVALDGVGRFEVLYVEPRGGRAFRRAAMENLSSKGSRTSGGEGALPAETRSVQAGRGRGDRVEPSSAGQGGSEPSDDPGRDGAGSESGALESKGTGPLGTFTETPCSTEAELIELLCARVADLDPDVLTGWNVVDFDLRVLEAAARRAGRPLRLGRTGESVRIRVEEGVRRTSRAEVAGRIVLDGIDLLRGAFVRLEDYRLETAARTLLGKGKLIASQDRGEEIERLYHEDLEAFLEYNANDARLVTEILEKTGVVDLAVKRSLLTGMPPDRVSASIASFDSLYLPELRRRGFVAPSVGGAEMVEATAGGAVLEPVTGLHDNVLVFDFRSLYPSLIRTFNLDPLGLIREPAPEADPASGPPIVAPNGARFRREPGILPALLDRLSSERAAARARGDAIASQAIKILMNSCYGVLATPACRFYSSAVANAITHFGQATLHWTKERAEAQGYAVLYGDTDSLFVSAGTDDEAEARRRGELLASRLNRDLSEHVRETHGVVSRLELEMQCLYRRLFLPSLRHGTAGARKRYAGLVVEAGKESIHFTGMEMVRRDWTELSKIFQRGLFERVFHGEDLGPWIREFIEELRGGAHDGHLVYRKALRKPISEYTATTPPHVKAAKALGARPGQIIDYVMTVNGPEPAAARTGSFDYAHYVDKQIRPVAEAVLTHLGLDFDELAGTDDGAGRQLDLFG